MRHLSSIQTITALDPIPGADAIERARVLGWRVVVRKGEFKVGERVVFCEIDSLLPERPEFEFLRASSHKPAQRGPDGSLVLPAGFRIRTLRLRGQVSQGICFPLSILPAGAPTEEGADLTELLGVRKWEPQIPAELAGRVKGAFSGFLSRTGETRVQLLEKSLEAHRGKLLHVTEKLDGVSFTAFLRDGVFGIGSRSWWWDETDKSNALARLADGLGLEDKLRGVWRRWDKEFALRAEAVGPGIAKNKYGLPGVAMFVYDVVDVTAGGHLGPNDALAAVAEMGLEPVPQLPPLVLNHTVDELVALAEGPSAINPKIQREGLVLRPAVETYDETIGGRLSFKVVNPKFLLKYDE